MRRRPLFYLAIIVVVLILLGWVFTEIFVYLGISVVLSAILRPLTNYIARLNIFRQRIPRFLAVILSFLTLGLVISLFVILFIPLISEQITVIGANQLRTVI